MKASFATQILSHTVGSCQTRSGAVTTLVQSRDIFSPRWAPLRMVLHDGGAATSPRRTARPTRTAFWAFDSVRQEERSRQTFDLNTRATAAPYLPFGVRAHE